MNTDLQYWNDNQEKIVEYCLIDCYLTKNIADYFWDVMYKALQFNPKHPYSKGHFSEEYFLSKCYIPTIEEIPLEAIEYAFRSYSGGRFELLQRGYFPQVYVYDIKSAYPSIIAELIDYSKGHWEKTSKFDESAYNGFYLCNIRSYEKIVSPFMQKVNTLNIYPNGQFMQYLSKSEIDFILKHFDRVEIDIIKGWQFYEFKEIYPFKDEVERIYMLKETEKDEDIKYCYKIILNSFYGKTIQTAGGKTGKVFNPIYAADITGKTRLKLLQFGLKHFDEIIGFSTDSIATTQRLEWRNQHKDKLGDFALDFKGSGYYVMSDIYHLWNEKKTKDRFRGFTIDFERDSVKEKGKNVNLKNLLDNMEWRTVYKYSIKRPMHLGEVLRNPFIKSLNKQMSKEDINIFYTMTKQINLNGDMKRVWEKPFKSAYEVMDIHHTSLPVLLKEGS